MKKTKSNNIFKQKNITEEQFLQAVENISKKLIYKFKFGYHELEDMKQQAMLFALDGLKKYDSDRPLENFLWTHVRNRLFNFKRDNYGRPDNVCVGCPLYDPERKKSTNCCAKFENKNDCEIYYEWASKKDTQKNILSPTSIDMHDSEYSNDGDISDMISNKEMITFINDNIHTKYRETYLRLKGGSKVPKVAILQLRKHIQQLLKDFKHE
jgi:DNA-directed RNA polymerase specialized sigma subunit